LSEEHRLTLAARTLEAAAHVDPAGELSIRIDEPWGDYQARGQHRLSPYQFVDALVRAGVGLTCVNLEFAVGYRPRGSAPRDVLEFSRLIDFWSRLGLPLCVTLAVPSAPHDAPHDDPQAQTELDVDGNLWGGRDAETAQAEWIDQYLPLLLAKDTVVGIVWSHFTDAAGHDFPHAGLLRGDGSPKPALQHLVSYLEKHW
ncbi:MAG: endo-1,4-beta-xylanase, partial [Planctomycetaceae bacterium]